MNPRLTPWIFIFQMDIVVHNQQNAVSFSSRQHSLILASSRDVPFAAPSLCRKFVSQQDLRHIVQQLPS